MHLIQTPHTPHQPPSRSDNMKHICPYEELGMKHNKICSSLHKAPVTPSPTPSNPPPSRLLATLDRKWKHHYWLGTKAQCSQLKKNLDRSELDCSQLRWVASWSVVKVFAARRVLWYARVWHENSQLGEHQPQLHHCKTAWKQESSPAALKMCVDLNYWLKNSSWVIKM